MRTEIVTGMSEQEYRDYDAINVSTLKKLRSGIPADINAPFVAGPAVKFGTLFHTRLLEPERWKDGVSYHLRPDTYPSKTGAKPWSGNADWCKEWLASHEDLPVIGSSGDYSMETIDNMIASVEAMPEAKRMLEWRSQREVVVFAPDEPTGLQMKGRIDVMAEDDDGRAVILDVKTTDDPSGWERTASNLGYWLQESFYTRLMNLNGVDPLFVFIVVGTRFPHAVRVGVLDQSARDRGERENRRLLDLYARHKASNDWPAYRVADDGNRVGLETFNLKIWT